ncbi:glucosamine-6-phosphate deaminase [Rothia sp. ZJ932]|uniref:glucosamine-6-phosphate deaminase n=1 Tax=Rothia sp. ZJ932 TaxID=2810516 RepID=UPI0019682C37|nr:glucosamine-6-phosphate deaminase [Rothia sp. ZJ932]QRZ61878.1 glucosamine-6-phosphate deaminase [Rothia sp. ZJ932]
MEIIIMPSDNEVGRYAASLMAKEISAKPNAVLGVATGSSPESTYKHLAQLTSEGLDLTNIKAFALDEYVGMDLDHPESYHSVIRREVVERVGLSPDNVRVPNGMAEDIAAECADYERDIKESGGVDIQLLGIGSNGHIGFNEPGSSLVSRTRIKTLAPKTVKDNARFFDGDESKVPVHCLTQGIGTIMEARKVLLVAIGKNKAKAVAGLVEGPIGTFCPASILQLHPNATIVVDEEAASELKNTEYYNYARDNMPNWQRPETLKA